MALRFVSDDLKHPDKYACVLFLASRACTELIELSVHVVTGASIKTPQQLPRYFTNFESDVISD